MYRRTALAVLAVGAVGGAAAFAPSPLAGGLNSLGRRIGVAAKSMVLAPDSVARARPLPSTHPG